MLIACYVGRDGEVADFFQPGSLCLFENKPGAWELIREVALNLDSSMSLSALKAHLAVSIQSLGGGQVFLARELRGVLRVFLEEMGYRVWKSHGSLENQLEDAASQEHAALEAQRLADAQIPSPESVGDPEAGLFRIDLVSLLSEGSCHVSRDLLMPFLETISFAKLEVICDHVPRWFAMELPELGLEARVPEVAPGQEMTVVLVPQHGARSVPPGRRPGKTGCSCGG